MPAPVIQGTRGLSRAGLLLPALAALPVLAILLALGTWQVQRMHWKHELLARIAASEAVPAAPLTGSPEPFSRVSVRGRFLHDRESLVGAEVRGNLIGARLLTPLERPGARIVLVDRGWVPLEPRDPVSRPTGTVDVVGYVHPGDLPGLMAARDDPSRRRFYTLYPPDIATALGLPAAEPFALVALADLAAPPGLPDPQRELPRPTDPHLGYAVTWYGLALSLCGVFAAFAIRRLKEPAA